MITREYPQLKENKPYPYKRNSSNKINYNYLRYNKSDFETYRNINRSNYNKLISGINYNTGRKIGIDGKLYTKLIQDFYIRGKPFTYMDNLIEEEYLKETERLIQKSEEDYELKIKQIDEEYELIKLNIDEENKKNASEYMEYNTKILELRTKINLLKWDEYVEYEGKLYGLPKVLGKIHKENNCGGIMEPVYYEEYCGCKACENWFGCNNPQPRSKYVGNKCHKCGIQVNFIFLTKLNFTNTVS